jgi:hypothetical protein
VIWNSEQVTAKETITVTIVDIVFNPPTYAYSGSYQLKFSDGTWIITEVRPIIASLRIGHTYRLSIIKQNRYVNWVVTGAVEVNQT